MTLTEEIIRKIDYFRSHPDASRQLLEVIDTPGTTTEKLLSILEYDIALTANILKTCNSPAYFFSSKIHSLKEAVDCLGLEELKKLVAMSASSHMFAKGRGDGYEAGMGEMRRHSTAAAIISRQLLRYAPNLEGCLFTTCLLHDIGKLVLSEYVSEYYEEILRLINEKKL